MKMKKLLVIATVVAGAYAASAQGLINFNNSSAASSKISVNSSYGGAATGLSPAGASSFYYELFYSTAATTEAGAGTIPPAVGQVLTSDFVTSDTAWIDSQASAASSATAGRVSGSATAVVNGVAGAAYANFVIIGWSANIGSTITSLETYLASPSLANSGGTTAYVGESLVIDGLQLGNGAGVSAPTALSATTIPGFTLGEVNPVPEPSTIALGVMGAASLLALRRKKA